MHQGFACPLVMHAEKVCKIRKVQLFAGDVNWRLELPTSVAQVTAIADDPRQTAVPAAILAAAAEEKERPTGDSLSYKPILHISTLKRVAMSVRGHV